MEEVGLLLPGIFLPRCATEHGWSLLHGRAAYNAAGAPANLAIGNGLIRPAALAWACLVMAWLEPAQRLRHPIPARPSC